MAPTGARLAIIGMGLLVVLLGVVSSADAESPAAEGPPEIPVGLDAYLQWEKWPYQRIGARSYMRSTYDRKGGNESADASHYLYQLEGDINVSLDVIGRGYLYFARYNHWHGSPWHYEVDGNDSVVQETTTADPTKKLSYSEFMPRAQFPTPLTYTYTTTKGADLMWVPIGFADRFRMGYERTFYGTGYYIYHLYAPDAPTSKPIVAWDDQSQPDARVIDFLNSSGTDIAPSVAQDDTVRTYQSDSIDIPAGGSREVLRIEDRAMVRAIQLRAPRDQAVQLGRARLRITWDNRSEPSVDAPLALFFGAGTLHNRDNVEYLVKALPVNVRFDDENVHLACYFPMPFFSSAKIELIGPEDGKLKDVSLAVRTQGYVGPRPHVGYFHATYQDHVNPKRGHDLVLLDTNLTEGGGPWSGSFVGTSFIFSDRAVLGTLEGDPRFFFDDAKTPQAQGTGTEEWGGGGDYWGGQNMTLPLAGHPVGVRRAQDAKNSEELIQSAYRYLLADLMPFGHRAVIKLEHGGHNRSVEHYQTVAYWYGAPFATLVKTDSLDVGDPASEAAHDYHSPEAGEPYTLTSRYELGDDYLRERSTGPIANPKGYAEFQFEAVAGKEYTVWVRGRGLKSDLRSDAAWMQFDQFIGTDKRHAGHIEKGIGNWLDDTKPGAWSWSSNLPGKSPATIRFDRTGTHRLRIQRRDGTHEIAAIWLSTTQTERPAAESQGPRSQGPTEILLAANEVASTVGEIKQVNRQGQLVLSIGPDGRQPDSVVETNPAITKTGRATKAFSEFSLDLAKDNWGVMLRRTLDYKYPNQCARVYVAEAGTDKPRWQQAGVWYLAGANTYYYSYPGRTGKDRYKDRNRGERAGSAPEVQTSNRRLRDDEFLISHKLTRGHKQIRIRVEFEPLNQPLLPGMELAEQGWSEIAYDCYCYLLPRE